MNFKNSNSLNENQVLSHKNNYENGKFPRIISPTIFLESTASERTKIWNN